MMSFRSLVLAAFLSCAGSVPAHAQSTATPQREYRVLLVGNSLTYTNNLPALLRAVGASQGTSIATETYAAPDGTLAERWRDGKVADALRGRKFDVVVVQEIGAQLACLTSASRQRTAPCAASVHAHEELVALATAQGAKTLLFTTWARDERTQGRIDRGMRQLAKDTGAGIFNAAGAVAALQKAQPDASPYPDGTHPSTQASLMLAVALYRDITGTTPTAKALRIDAPLLPVNAAVSGSSPLETQTAFTGDGKAVIVPASLIEPLVKALPDPNAKADIVRERRGR